MVSIKDVAQRAGVAISTVSKVLNNYPGVSTATREKVNHAIEELDFVPNAVAAALSSKKGGRIAMVLDIGDHVSAADEGSLHYLSGALHKATELRLDVITVFASTIRDMDLEQLTRYLQSQNIAGLILFAPRLSDKQLWRLIGSERFACVVVEAAVQNAHTSCVVLDEAAAQQAVAQRTAAENPGHKILYLAGDKDSFVTSQRLAGMEQLAKASPGYKVTVRQGGGSELRARQLTLRYGKGHDMIVCGSDVMAIGAMRALIQMDIFRPVCGFGGISLMGYAGKQMTTVRRDYDGQAAAAVEEVARLMAGEEGRQITMPWELVRITYEDVLI